VTLSNNDWKEFGELKQRVSVLATSQNTHEAVCAERWKSVNDKLKWGFIILGFLIALQMGVEKAEIFLRLVGFGGIHAIDTIKKPPT